MTVMLRHLSALLRGHSSIRPLVIWLIKEKTPCRSSPTRPGSAQFQHHHADRSALIGFLSARSS
jgi:hypothetical protein